MLARSPHDLEPARPLARYITGSPLRPRLQRCAPNCTLQGAAYARWRSPCRSTGHRAPFPSPRGRQEEAGASARIGSRRQVCHAYAARRMARKAAQYTQPRHGFPGSCTGHYGHAARYMGPSAVPAHQRASSHMLSCPASSRRRRKAAWQRRTAMHGGAQRYTAVARRPPPNSAVGSPSSR